MTGLNNALSSLVQADKIRRYDYRADSDHSTHHHLHDDPGHGSIQYNQIGQTASQQLTATSWQFFYICNNVDSSWAEPIRAMQTATGRFPHRTSTLLEKKMAG